jgi:hypothetical protein
MTGPSASSPPSDAALASIRVVNDLAHDRAHVFCYYSDYCMWEGWSANVRDLVRMAVEHLSRDHGVPLAS